METFNILSSPPVSASLFGYIREGKVFLKAYLHLPDRQIGEVKISEEASTEYFVKRFDMAQQKVEELRQLVETAENKGSYLMKLVHLRQYLTDFDGLGDFPSLFAQLDEIEAGLREQVAANRVKNLEIKRDMIETASQLAQSNEWKEVSEQLKELKIQWIKTGSVGKELDEKVEMEFQEKLDLFFQRRKDFFEAKIRVIRDRLKLYIGIIAEAESMKESEDWDTTAPKFKKLHERWKAVGKIPHKKATSLWDAFRAASDFFFERYKAAKGLPNKPRPKPVDPKAVAQEKICVEIESLLEDRTIESGAERTKQLMMQWREIGVLPKTQRKDLLERYRLACDKIFETNYLIRVIKRKHPFYDEKPIADRLRIKVAVMTDLIRKDKTQTDMLESSIAYSRQTPDKDTQIKLTIQKRKISVKETLLADYQNGLTELKKQIVR
jgi:hypothetical protein